MSTQDVMTGEAPRRYARSLLELAEDATSLKTVEKDLKTVKKMFAGSADLRALVVNPVFATDDKVSAITAVSKKAGVSKLVLQFVGLMTQNRRAHEIPAAITAFEAALAKRRGTEVAKVTSAKKLTGAQLTKLKSELKKTLGRSVDIETDIDPDLIGGFVVKIGSRLYDSSIKTQIEDMKLALKSA